MRTGLRVAQLAAALMILATVTSAMAQGRGQGRRGGFGGGGVPVMAVIQNEKVQSDLVLSADQKSQVTKLVEEQQAQRGQGGGFGAGGAGGFQAIRDEQLKKINEILVKPQQDRFAEILLQLQGTTQNLADAKIAEKLGLTSDQKSKLETLQQDYQQKIRDAIMNAAGGGGGRGGFNNPEVTKLRDEENTKAKELLTADQQKQYETMLGKKIDIDPASLRGNRGRRGQGAQPNA